MGAMKRLGAAGLIAAVPATGMVLARCAASRFGGGNGAPVAPDEVVTTAVALVGAMAAAYLTLTAIPFFFAGRARAVRATVGHRAPRAWRTLIVLALGLGASASGATVAMAVSPDWGGEADPDRAPIPSDSPSLSPMWDAVDHASPVMEPSAPWPLEWGATGPDVVSGEPVSNVTTPIEAPVTPAVVPTPLPSPHPSPAADAAQGTPGTHVVVAGESLWRIAKALLPAGASDTQITQTWQAIYWANRNTVGADPGLIFPGQVLTLPPEVRR